MSDNPYKGVPGGDPRLRAAHQKSIVPIAYICVHCNKQKTEDFPEGKDLTGRICMDCRNEESVRKQKIRDEEARIRWAAYLEGQRRKPNRSAEERAALMEEYASSPKHRCDPCGNEFFIENPKFPFSNDSIRRDNAILTVAYRADPYDYEINDEVNMYWMCRSCYENIADDI